MISIDDSVLSISSNDDTQIVKSDLTMLLSEGLVELSEDIQEFSQYVFALDYIQTITERFYGFGDNIPAAVVDFVDQNKELSACLGIDVSATIEEMGAEAPKAIDEAAKKNIFQRAWAKIAAFFKAIWRKISSAFSWVFNGFRSISKKVPFAKKKWLEMSPEDRSAFLKNTKVKVPAQQFIVQLGAIKELLVIITNNVNRGSAPSKLLSQYLIDPTAVFPPTVFENLKKCGFALSRKDNHESFKDMIDSEESSVFGDQLRLVEYPKSNAEAKSFEEQGWTSETISQAFSKAEEISNVLPGATSAIKSIESSIDAITPEILSREVQEAKKATSSKFAKFLSRTGLKTQSPVSSLEVATARKAMANIVTVYKVCFTATSKAWHDLNSILDAFRYSPEEMKEFNKGSEE